MKKIRKIFKYPIFVILALINRLKKKNENSIYFIPHDNCFTDAYDVINYSSDNVLSIINFMLRKSEFNGYSFYIEVYNLSRIDEYKEYCNQINNNVNVFFLKNGLGRNHLLYRNFVCFSKCKYCFTAEHHYDVRYKSKSQMIICLGYFTPFKNDFRLSNNDYEKIKFINNKCFDLYVTTSNLASRIISVDTGISYYKFAPLGFSRNDILYKNFDNSKLFNELKYLTNRSIKHIILYTPTFRNYEYKKNNLPVRNIFGYNDADLGLMNDMLEKHEAIIIAKLHPYQNRSVISKDLPSNVHLSTTINNFSLYEYLTISDILITDYTSTYFDFLFLDRPVVFNFYDKERYEKDRGFSFDPIDAFCAGEMVDKYDSLLSAIENALHDVNQHKAQRNYINNIINKYHDGDSSQRIIDYIFKEKI